MVFKFLRLLLNIWLDHYHLLHLWKCVLNIAFMLFKTQIQQTRCQQSYLGQLGFYLWRACDHFDLITYWFAVNRHLAFCQERECPYPWFLTTCIHCSRSEEEFNLVKEKIKQYKDLIMQKHDLENITVCMQGECFLLIITRCDNNS